MKNFNTIKLASISKRFTDCFAIWMAIQLHHFSFPRDLALGLFLQLNN